MVWRGDIVHGHGTRCALDATGPYVLSVLLHAQGLDPYGLRFTPCGGEV